MDIMTGLHAVSETLKITKELRNIESELDKSELKKRLSDLIDGLLETKEALQNARENERELKDQIRELEIKLAEKGSLEDEDGCLFELDDNGKRMGEPYCNKCFVKEEKKYRMRFVAYHPGYSGTVFMAATPAHYHCDNCSANFGHKVCG